MSTRDAGVTGRNISSQVSEASAMSTMFSLVDKLEKLSINLVKLTNEQQGGFSATATGFVSAGQGTNQRRQFTCFHCNQPGHKKYDCPSLNGTNAATRSNAVPIGAGVVGPPQEQSQGKGQEYQL